MNKNINNQLLPEGFKVLLPEEAQKEEGTAQRYSNDTQLSPVPPKCRRKAAWDPRCQRRLSA